MDFGLNPGTLISLGVILVGGVSGYAVLKKRVNDLEEVDNLTVDKHDDLCTIAGLEMKQHLTDTIIEFESKTFKPAIQEIIQEIRNRK